MFTGIYPEFFEEIIYSRRLEVAVMPALDPRQNHCGSSMERVPGS